jgi:hypothetical protein
MKGAIIQIYDYHRLVNPINSYDQPLAIISALSCQRAILSNSQLMLGWACRIVAGRRVDPLTIMNKLDKLKWKIKFEKYEEFRSCLLCENIFILTC